MANYRSVGWDMYDPRTTIKATVATGVTVYLGYACRINSSGDIVVDHSGGAGEERVHGCALTDAVAGDELVLVTHGRLKVVDAQDIGDIAYGGQDGSGSTPNTGVATGHPCGWAIEEKLLFIHIDNVSAAE